MTPVSYTHLDVYKRQLFFFLSMLEDTGYMARVAFVLDKLLRRIGLSGRSIVPMRIGFGCTGPGVMASRTLPSERDRKMTILLTPFMSCSAKLPIYSLFAAAFFPKYAGLVMVLLYFTGILVGVLAALLLKSTVFTGEAVPFVMELPDVYKRQVYHFQRFLSISVEFCSFCTCFPTLWIYGTAATVSYTHLDVYKRQE